MSIAKAFRWYKRQHWFVKYALGMFFLTIAVILTIETGGSVGAILIDLAIGIGFGIGGYLLGSLLTQQALTWEGLGNAVLDAFLFTSAFLFMSSGINAIKYLCRSRAVTTAELANEVTQNKYLEFESQVKLEEHFAKHGSQFKGMYSNSQEYLQGANYVINNGSFVLEMNGYVRFFGTGRCGAEYAFVGLTHDGAYITTFGIRNIKSLSKIPWLIP